MPFAKAGLLVGDGPAANADYLNPRPYLDPRGLGRAPLHHRRQRRRRRHR